MAQFDDYISAVTRRLRPDAELQMDIAHELRTHLEDAAEAAHAGGMDEDASQSAAVRAFGDADELATALFEANRRRMRLRAVIKWTARATLMPAVLLVTAFVVWTAVLDLVTGHAMYNLDSSGVLGKLRWTDPHAVDSIVKDLAPARSDLTDDERFVAERLYWYGSDGRTKPYEELIARFPTDRRYHALYTRMLLYRGDSESLPRVLAALDRGNEIDPDNALYDALRASVLMQWATRPPWAISKPPGFQITDETAFAAGIAALRQATQKKYLRNYADDLEEEWLNSRQPPETVTEQMGLVTHVLYGCLPELGILRDLAFIVPQYALKLADEGRTDEALELLGAVERVNIMLGAHASRWVTAVSPYRSLVRVLGWRAHVLEEAGRTDAATTVRNRLALEKPRPQNAHDAARQSEALLGNRNSTLLASIGPFSSPDPRLVEQTRRAELSVVLRTALSLMMLAPLLGAVFLSILVMRYLAFRRRCYDCALFFDSWRRPPRVVLWVLSVAAVACMVWFGVLNPLLQLWPISHYGWQPVYATLLICVPAGAVLLATLVTLGISLRCTHDDRTLLLFIGWKHMARILLWAVAAPAAGYVVWLCVLPNPLMNYGVAHCLGQLAFDVALLSVVSASALLHFGCRAIRKRMTEAGMELPADRFFRPLYGPWGTMRAAGLLLLTLICVTTWGPSRATESRLILVSSCTAVLLTGWALYTLRQFNQLRTDESASSFRGTFIRSLLPIVIASLVAAAAVTHITLRWTERRAIRAINQPDYQPLLDEIPLRNGGHALREHHRELDRRWRERRRDDAHEQRGE
jgi:hypothetical protein